MIREIKEWSARNTKINCTDETSLNFTPNKLNALKISALQMLWFYFCLF